MHALHTHAWTRVSLGHVWACAGQKHSSNDTDSSDFNVKLWREFLRQKLCSSSPCKLWPPLPVCQLETGRRDLLGVAMLVKRNRWRSSGTPSPSLGYWHFSGFNRGRKDCLRGERWLPLLHGVQSACASIVAATQGSWRDEWQTRQGRDVPTHFQFLCRGQLERMLQHNWLLSACF